MLKSFTLIGIFPLGLYTSPMVHHLRGITMEIDSHTVGLLTEEPIMGLMDQMGQVAGGLLGGQTGQNSLLQAVTSLLGNNSNLGGLAGLVEAFQKNGLGEIVNSWVSTGQNMPASPQQIEQGLGSDLLKQLASKAWLSPQDASSQLSDLLPSLIDKLTPNGKIEAGPLEQLLKLVQGK